MRVALRSLLLLGLLLPVSRAVAQVRPDLDWRTLETAHFRVHFTPETEPLARRIAAHAERAWARLAEELVPPRGPVDVVVADNVDFANGYATPFPSNRIVLYARPPVEVMALRNHADWHELLVTHELVHIFHLDRVRGPWRLAQRLLGRAAPFFPNSYAPRWLTEGLAVHYETKLTGGGRLAGTEFPMYVRAAARADALPPLDALSLDTPFWPGGDIAYLFGAYAVSRGDSASLGALVEASSARLIPWRHDANARDALGGTFTARWREWRDSVRRVEASVRRMGDARTELTTHEFTARFPRFVADDALVYVANDAREVTGLYALGLDAARRRLGRRNSVDVSTPVDGRRTVQGELDYADPYSLRSDLFRGEGLRRRRLGRGERLSSPDVHRPSGAIVAVRTDPGTTSLVLVDPVEGFVERDVARGTLDRTWAEPRWSRDGQRIAAVRWERGGRTAVVVMGRDGRAVRTFAPRGPRISIVSAPVFEPGDSTLLFVSDHEGLAMLYRGDLRTGAYGRLWASPTGLNTPDVSPDGQRIAAVELAADGYRVVVRDTPSEVALALPADDTLPDPLRPLLAAPEDREAESRRYAAGPQLAPTWWLPVFAATGTGRTSLGLQAGMTDVLARHAWNLEARVEPTNREWTVFAGYAWAGLGVPVLAGAYERDWTHGVVRDTAGAFLGYLAQRRERVAADVVFERPRVRASSYLVVGGEAEAFTYRSYPGYLLPGLGNAVLEDGVRTSAVYATVGVNTLQRATNAVSAADGVALALTQRQRFGAGVQFEDVSETIASFVAAKSLPLPGYARHVLALRGAYGVTGHRTTTAFSVGGVSGQSLEVLPGIVIGGARRTFAVRGFPEGAQLGVRAAAGSVEYRAPLARIGRGVRLLPTFLQKASLTGFADAGLGWCEFGVTDSFICRDGRRRATLTSVGGELALDASLQYDFSYRFRLGVARPVNGEAYAVRATSIYFTLGSSF